MGIVWLAARSILQDFNDEVVLLIELELICQLSTFYINSRNVLQEAEGYHVRQLWHKARPGLSARVALRSALKTPPSTLCRLFQHSRIISYPALNIHSRNVFQEAGGYRVRVFRHKFQARKFLPKDPYTPPPNASFHTLHLVPPQFTGIMMWYRQ